MEKERRTKALLLCTLVVVVATLSIAFAAMSRTLSINGIGKMDTAKWNVYFDNLSNAKITRGAEELGKPNINLERDIVENIKVKLSNPKDEISYTVDIVNDGTIAAEITMIKDIELTDAQKKIFEFKVTYTATGNLLKDGDVLPAGKTKNITINIKFKDDITEADLPTESQTINLSYQITYTQYDGEIPVGPNGDITKNAVLAHDVNTLMSAEDPVSVPFFNGKIGRGQVKSISFVYNKNVPEEAALTIWDASEKKDNSIVGWYLPSNTEGLYDVYIGSDVNIYAPSDSTLLFGLTDSLKEINFNNFNTSNVTNMSMLFYATPFTSLDLSSFNTSNVTNMTAMFNSLPFLANLNLSSFDTSKVTNMYGMFMNCDSLISLDLRHFDVSNVKDMSYMFYGSENNESKLQSINLSGWNAKNVEKMESMFRYCVSLTTLNLSSFKTLNVTTMQEMFRECPLLTSLDLSSFNTSNVTDMVDLFYGCSSLTSLDLSSFNTSNVIEMSRTFYGCSSLTTLDLSSFDTSKVTDMGSMFYKCSSLTSLDISSFNTSNVTDMGSMFYKCSSLTSLDISSFNTSKVTYMGSMFHECSSLTSLDISSFNTSNISYMSGIFEGCSSLTSLDLSSFVTTKVTSMDRMFEGCSSLTSLDLSSFDTSNVTYMSGMFEGCSSLTNLDLSSFKTNNVNNMNHMFYDCSALLEIKFNNANFTNVSSGCTDMFYNVPTSVHIVVKDENERSWMNRKFPSLTNVVLPSEL